MKEMQLILLCIGFKVGYQLRAVVAVKVRRKAFLN